jgi:DNA-directed RNA polymerase subunit M
MEFCPKCGIMLTKKGDKYACSKCGHSKANVTIGHSEKMPEKKKIAVIEKEESSLAQIDADCAKCGNRKAYFWQIQTRGADESPTSFFKCTKCRHTWREYT